MRIATLCDRVRRCWKRPTRGEEFTAKALQRHSRMNVLHSSSYIRRDIPRLSHIELPAPVTMNFQSHMHPPSFSSLSSSLHFEPQLSSRCNVVPLSRRSSIEMPTTHAHTQTDTHSSRTDIIFLGYKSQSLFIDRSWILVQDPVAWRARVAAYKFWSQKNCATMTRTFISWIWNLDSKFWRIVEEKAMASLPP